MSRLVVHSLVIVILVSMMSSCSTLRRWTGRDKSMEVEAVQQEAIPAADKAACEAQLREDVEEHIQQAKTLQNQGEAMVLRRRPYYLKEYVIYPDGPKGFTLILHETDSRTRPYLATIEVKKELYSTALHKKRDQARRDTDFFRDTGTEKLTYEFRNGHWIRTGGAFIAEKSETKVDDTWTNREEKVSTSIMDEDKEESQGWFGKTKDFIIFW